MVAVSDTGYWFEARLERQGDRLAGVAAMRATPLLDERGCAFRSKWQIDAEGLERVPGGWLVSVERDNRVVRYRGDPFAARLAGRVERRFRLAPMRRNRGLEAIAARPDGGLLVLAEDAPRGADAIEGFLARGTADPAPQRLLLRRTGGYSVTDAAFLPGGDLLVMERRFSVATGPAMRIRRIAASDVGAGRTMDGPVLIEASLPHQIDNMEGLAVTPHPEGHRLTLVSDDNRSLLQRTLVLEFLLRD